MGEVLERSGGDGGGPKGLMMVEGFAPQAARPHPPAGTSPINGGRRSAKPHPYLLAP